jgi:hypothetical protein
MKTNVLFLSAIIAVLNIFSAFPQKEDSLLLQLKSLGTKTLDYQHRFDILEKQIDDLMCFAGWKI